MVPELFSPGARSQEDTIFMPLLYNQECHTLRGFCRMNCANSKKTRRVSGENLLVQIAKMCHTKLQTCCNLENSELQASHGATAPVHPFYVSSSTSSAPPPHPPLPLTPFPSLLLPLPSTSSSTSTNSHTTQIYTRMGY